MAVSDLTNTAWEIKEWPTISTSTDNTYSINFTANNISYTAFRLRNNGEYNYIYYNTTKVFDSDLGSWGDYSNYRTINITGGTDVTNATLIAWLEANAIQQATPTVTYDLTQLSLSTGTYTITVKAKATGYSDSVASNSVTYTVAPSGFNVTITESNSSQSNLNYKSYLKIYDGQDRTGTLLINSTGTTTMPQTNFTCTTGYLYLENYSTLGAGYTQIGKQNIVGNISQVGTGYDSNPDGSTYIIMKIEGDGSFQVWTDYNYD